jgi:hypothetical protein
VFCFRKLFSATNTGFLYFFSEKMAASAESGEDHASLGVVSSFPKAGLGHDLGFVMSACGFVDAVL